MLDLAGHDVTVWDPDRQHWVIEAEEAEIVIAASSHGLRLAVPLSLRPSVLFWPRVQTDTQPVYILDNPIARPILRQEFAQWRI